jgi:hypothetical protein
MPHAATGRTIATRNAIDGIFEYVASLRNDFVIDKAGILDSGLFRATAGRISVASQLPTSVGVLIRIDGHSGSTSE